MRIAVSAENNDGLQSRVSSHFGRCPYFMLVEVQDGQIQNVSAVDNPFYSAHAPGQVPSFIRGQQADAMLAGGMGRRAIAMFEDMGVDPVSGVTGAVGPAVQAYLAGNLTRGAPCAEHEAHHGHGRHRAGPR
jgi:predicted Fe-Mo cluster-binding NifX family protein